MLTDRVPVHAAVYCKDCLTGLRGLRYRCGHCEDYDLCETCFRYTQHPRDHIFLVMREPRNDVSGPVLEDKLQTKSQIIAIFSPIPDSANPFGGLLTKQDHKKQRQFAPMNRAFMSQSDSESRPDVQFPRFDGPGFSFEKK